MYVNGSLDDSLDQAWSKIMNLSKMSCTMHR
jgi:hypothetical protein